MSGYVERAVFYASKPCKGDVEENQTKRNELVRGFLTGEVNRKELDIGLKNIIDSCEGLVLPYPGPLYGLLRKIGLDQKNAEIIAYEERAHYDELKQLGFNSKIIIQFTLATNELPGVNYKEAHLNVFTVYELPTEIDDETLKSAINKIALAPDHPSQDDLAKLP